MDHTKRQLKQEPFLRWTLKNNFIWDTLEQAEILDEFDLNFLQLWINDYIPK